MLSLDDGSGVTGGFDDSGGTSGVVGGVAEGLGVGGGVVSSAGGVLPAGVDGVGSEGVGVGLGDSGGLSAHSFSPPFHAAMRWYGVLTPSGW